jgi:hypothetical protein
MRQSTTVNGVDQYELASWADFLPLTNDVFSKRPAFVFRGQASSSWPLLSTLDRLEQRFPKRKNLVPGAPEFFEAPPLSDEQHLNAFKRAVRGRRGPNAPSLNEDEYWALGQHHGLATPLLDFTRSPYVALFFAFEEETICVDGKMIPPESRAVYALSTRIIEIQEKGQQERVQIVSPESDANYRLISQAALFVKMLRRTDLESYVRARCCDTGPYAFFTKIIIPNRDRHACLIALNKMNINHMSLFPDIDGAAKHVNSLWQPGHEDSVPFV